MKSWRSSFGRAFAFVSMFAAVAAFAVACGSSAPAPFSGQPTLDDGGEQDAAMMLPTPPGDDATAPDDSASTVLPGADADTPDSTAAADTAVPPPPNLAPAPTLASIAPSSALVGTTGPTIVCTGAGFVARSVVQVNGIALTTSFVSATEVRATIPTADMGTVGPLHVTVGTAPPGGGASAEVVFTVVNPSPAITALQPTSTLLGSAATPLTVVGSSFVMGAAISFNGTALPTTVTDSKTATATIPASSLTTSGTFPVTVSNPAPGGGASSSIAFIVTNPTVSITSVTPSTLVLGGPAASLALVGTGFVAASSVSFNGAAIATTYTSATQLAATVPASALLNAGDFPVAVTNPAPGGGVSAPVTVHVVYPAVTATSLTPASAILGASPPTITVTGTGFLSGVTRIAFDGASSLTTVTDATHAQATLTTAQMSASHTFQVTVVNPAPGGGTSAPALTFSVNDPVPVATAVTPSSLLVGAPDTTVTLTGSGFVSASTVLLGASPLATTYVNGTTLKAVVPAANFASTGSLSFFVSSPAPGGGTSSPAVTLTVNNPAPAAMSVAPSFALVGSPDTTVTIAGSNFVPSATVFLGASALATTYVSATSVTAVIPAANLGAAVSLSLTVTNPKPGGGTTGALAFTVDNSGPAITQITPSSTIVPSAAIPITVSGTGLSGVSVVQVGTTALATTFSGGALQATIPAAQLAAAATLSITVANPPPGGGTSNVMYFTADDPLPVLTAVSPAQIYALSAATSITLTGSGFVTASTVQVNGASVTVTARSATSLTATLPAATLASPTTLSVTVVNPAPGGGTSAAQTINVVCNTSAATIVLSALNTPSTVSLDFSGATAAYRITTTEQSDSCPSQDDTSASEPFLTYVVVNDTAQPATLAAWAVCTGKEDAFLTFLNRTTPPTTQAQFEACEGFVAEGAEGAGDHFSPQSGSSQFCPGLTKAHGDGLTLAACATAMVVIQPFSTTSSSYIPPTSMTIELQ